MRKIAVTGAPGSGKSTICRLFAEWGAHVVDADAISHQLIEGASRQAIIELFGPEIEKEGHIDRQAIANIVFKNPRQLKALEKILHPKILEHIQQEYKRLDAEKTSKWFIAEVPLLFELGWEKHFDTTICVTAEPTNCQKRFAHEWNERMAHQLPIGEKAERADIVIHNDGDIDQLKQQIQDIIAKIGA